MTTTPIASCPVIVYIDSEVEDGKYRGKHECNLPEGHEGQHTDGAIVWIGASIL